MADTANETTYHHYSTPGVKEAILRYAQTNEGWRVMNGDFVHWYQYDHHDQKRLNQPEDFPKLISRYRVIYTSLDVFNEEFKGTTIPDSSDDPLGTFRDCKAFSLGTDIDLIVKDLADPVNIEALEKATQFHISDLAERGITKSVKALFSVGGSYVILDHRLFMALDETSPETREMGFNLNTRCYGHYLHEMANRFFQKYPEYRGRVKFDSLNNRKRLFKTVFSLHKSIQMNGRPLAVIPLDPDHIKIEPEKAMIPLSCDVIASGATWYEDRYDQTETNPLIELLGKYRDVVKAETRDATTDTRNGIFISSVPYPFEAWPPCIRNIVANCAPDKGPHRALAVLAEFLGQAGIDQDEAMQIWMETAEKGGIPDRVDIFYEYFQRFITPLCTTIKDVASGYPLQGLGDLGYCQPDETCCYFDWPVEYARRKTEVIRVEALHTKFQNNPKAIYDDDVLEELARLRAQDVIGYEQLTAEVRTRHKVKLTTIYSLIDQYIAKRDAAKPVPISPRVVKIGNAIMRKGDVIKVLTVQAQRNHVGDTGIIKHLLASVASTNSLTSAGIQPAISGPKGAGKTDAARAVLHLVPPGWKEDTSISSKTPYYISWRDGLIVFSDDIEWSPEIIHTLKRAMGRFQVKQKHTALDKELEPISHEMAARVAWWLSSVDSVASEQLIDRQYSLDVEDDEKHAEGVCNYIKTHRSQKKLEYLVDWKIEVARYIIGKIKDHEPFRVVIPCAEKANWFMIKDHRTHKKFWDLVEAFAILRYEQRHTDKDGWLYATKADFKDAKELFTARKVSHKTKLTDAQKAVVAAVYTEHSSTQASIAQTLNKSQQAVSNHLKVIMENTPYITAEKGLHGETIYRSNFNPLDLMEEGIVTLPDGYEDPVYPDVTTSTNDIVGMKTESLQPTYNPLTTKVTTPTINNIKTNTTYIQHKKGIKREKIKGGVISKDIAEKNSLPLSGRKRGCKVVRLSLHTESGPLYELVQKVVSSTDNEKKLYDGVVSSLDSGKSEVCPVCGDDISPGHGSYGGLCTSCGPKAAIVRGAMCSHAEGMTVDDLFSNIASMGRPPKREYLPAMLRVIGCQETGGVWKISA